MCALAPHRQPAAGTDPAIAPDIHQALDVHGDRRAEGALDAIIALDDLAQPIHVGVRQLTHAQRGADPRGGDDLGGVPTANPEDVGQPDLDLLVAREVNTGNTSHALALPLLVFGVALANNAHHAVALHHFTVLANGLDAAPDFHGRLLRGGAQVSGYAQRA